MSNQVDQMSPDVSPGAVSKKAGVRRVNNVPMYILGAALGGFLLIMMLVAADRAAKQNEQANGAAEKAGNTSMFAREIVGDNDSGIVPPLTPPELPKDLDTPPVLVARPDIDAPPSPPSQPERDEEAERIRMAKLQMFQEAVKAKTTVRVDAPRSSGSSGIPPGTPQTRDEMLARLAAVRQQMGAEQQAADPTAAYQARVAQLRAAGIGGQQTGGGMGGGTPQLVQGAGGQRNSFAQFGANGAADRWRLDSQPEAPRSPYELRAGFVVPATLISGINSDLPGQITAQVAQNVYDTPTGKHLLIPQGSRLVGAYSSEVAYGQKRVLVAWQRIVFPDGKAMDIGSMPGADGAGYAGFNDQVNNHYLRVFGSAFLMSGVVAAVSLSQDNGASDGTRQRASDALSESLGQVLGNTIAQLISKNLSIAPTLEIRPGYRFNVIVTKDMTFSKPYRSFDY